MQGQILTITYSVFRIYLGHAEQLPKVLASVSQKVNLHKIQFSKRPSLMADSLMILSSGRTSEVVIGRSCVHLQLTCI